jgi:hypothetical protein
VPDEDLDRVSAHVAVQLQLDHRLLRLEEIDLIDADEPGLVDGRNPVLAWAAGLELGQRNCVPLEIGVPACGDRRRWAGLAETWTDFGQRGELLLDGAQPLRFGLLAPASAGAAGDREQESGAEGESQHW